MKMEEILQTLQIEQYRHDSKFHPDILCLPVRRRIAHMVLHNAKYVGKALEANSSGELHELKPILVDTFIIALASANIFNVELARACAAKQETQKHETPHRRDIWDWYISGIGKATGRMAKAVESVDHLEDYPFRRVLETNIIEIVNQCLAIAQALPVDIGGEVRRRWANVERKSVLHEPDHRAGEEPQNEEYRVA